MTNFKQQKSSVLVPVRCPYWSILGGVVFKWIVKLFSWHTNFGHFALTRTWLYDITNLRLTSNTRIAYRECWFDTKEVPNWWMWLQFCVLWLLYIEWDQNRDWYKKEMETVVVLCGCIHTYPRQGQEEKSIVPYCSGSGFCTIPNSLCFFHGWTYML